MSSRISNVGAARTLLLAMALSIASPAWASNPFLEVPPSAESMASPAYRYANASNEEIHQWLTDRALPFDAIERPVSGVRLAGRLAGPLHGVWVHGTDPEHGDLLPYEIIDGRLALALDDFCDVLSAAHIVELVHYTIFRPSASAALGAQLTRHSGALAIDVGALKRDDGTWLRVKRDWSPAIGAKTCGSGARKPESEFGQLLQGWVCEAREREIFHYALTPHFDAAHADHVHLEIKPGVKWFLYN